MTSTLLNGGNGHVDEGCTHLQASFTVASPAVVRPLQPRGRDQALDLALLVRHAFNRGGSAGQRSG
jgi:hypothetical protein